MLSLSQIKDIFPSKEKLKSTSLLVYGRYIKYLKLRFDKDNEDKICISYNKITISIQEMHMSEDSKIDKFLYLVYKTNVIYSIVFIAEDNMFCKYRIFTNIEDLFSYIKDCIVPLIYQKI